MHLLERDIPDFRLMHGPDPLPAFPPGAPLPAVSKPMSARNIGLRTAGTNDMRFLRALFHALKSEELPLEHWPEPFKQAFLDQQFALQHMQYVDRYPGADFWIVEHRNQPIGRYYLLREPSRYHIVDITLEPAWRGRGIGSLLLDWAQSLARRHGAAGISLQVDERNKDAQRLYARYGFVETSRESPYIAMQWKTAA
ncbi:GNAT family N-acetyltransferase [Rhodanobacter sp. Si-c]|uniref:GNAT family N-acetyltransferase n=1 Tax=Rhodanobacter lycopersici TaxID=3162487 RepID=A0ABV3QGP1_9GAMM